MENSEQEPKMDSSAEDFSMESLGVQNKPATEAAATPINPEANMSLGIETPDDTLDISKEELYRQITKEVAERRTNLEASVIEPHRLAKVLNRINNVDQNLLAHYLEAKDTVFNLESEEEIQEMARQLMVVEQQIIAPLQEQAHLFENQKQFNDLQIGVREAFYGMVLSGRMTAEKIREIFNGQIIFRDEPGNEIGNHERPEDMASFLHYDGSKFNIYVYKKIFENSNADMAFLMRHEFSHAAAFAIWGERYNQFLDAARTPHQSETAFKDAPELQKILRVLAYPQLGKPFYRKYISDLLEEIETSTDPQKTAELREHAAKEMVADMTAHFLEGSNSAETMIDLRTRYLEKDPEQFIDSILKLEGVHSVKELLKNYGLTGPFTPQRLVDALSQSPRLAGLFDTSKAWQEALTKKFENKGANLSMLDPEGESFVPDDYDGDIEYIENIPTRNYWEVQDPISSNIKAPESGGMTKGILDIWNLFTGTGKKAA